MEEIITFNKSFQHRFLEFNEVFSDNGYHVLPCSELQKQWTLFIEVTVDKVGWQAIWKLPRMKCEALGIPFPSIALVIVLTLNTKELKAYVRILSVQSDVHLPEKVWVPLTQLWPTKEQDKSLALDLMDTANSLDMLRFFYLYIYMPWDRDEDDSQDWKERHLESRLRFYYDLKNGNIPRVVGEHIHNLLTEARRLHQKREFLEEQIDKEELEGGDNPIDEHEDKRTTTLMEIHVRLLEIRTDIEIAENPLLRSIIIERFSQLNEVSKVSDSQIWLIFNQATAEEHINVLKQVQEAYPTEKLQFSNNLASKLASGNRNDTYLLNESTHQVIKTGALEEGGTLRGIGCKEKILLATNVEDVMFNFFGDLVVLENLTINVGSAQCGILVRRGTCHLKNCKIIGRSSSSVYQGIIALKGACLHLENCEITEFSTAIVGNSGSNLLLTNCNIHRADYGIKIFDDSKVTLQNVSISECSEFGFMLETETKEPVVGDFECLKKVQEVGYNDVVGIKNARGDVAILQRPKLKPLENLFANPDRDPTIIESDDEEML